jgi:tRNA dimethylallyltransferase
MQKVLVIVGPTASGKSALAVELARHFNGEIISADSRQVYRELNIGTGKITKREMRGIPHHLLDVVGPKQTFTAAEFIARGRTAISDIAQRGKLPIICGGTGFYIDALLGTVTLPNVPPNQALRAQLAAQSAAALFAKLRTLDPKRAQTIDPHNPVRLIRAIEIATALGAVPSKPSSELYDTLWIGIEWRPKKLHQRIHHRLLARMKNGMVAEAKHLHAGGLSYKRMRELGLEYRFLADYLQGQLDKETMLVRLETAIRQYAKRQFTYWKRNRSIHWISATKLATARGLIAQWLHN